MNTTVITGEGAGDSGAGQHQHPAQFPPQACPGYRWHLQHHHGRHQGTGCSGVQQPGAATSMSNGRHGDLRRPDHHGRHGGHRHGHLSLNQDTVFWIGGNAPSPFPGAKFGFNTGWLSWFPSTFQFVQDAADLDAYNRWGSPYPSGSPTAMGDGTVRTISYGISSQLVIALCTPAGGETVPGDF